MPENPAPQSFAPRIAVRHVQLGRAALAAIAAAMITFSSDHSASYGLAVFSGWAITTAIVLAVGGWMAYPAGRRWPALSLALVSAIAGMAGGVPMWRTIPLFFVVVIAWAVVAGVIETAAGWRERRLTGPVTAPSPRQPVYLRVERVLDPQRRSEARDAMWIGVTTLVLAVGLLLVPAGYRLRYFIPEAGQSFTLTGIAIGVGIFGAYAAIVAVFLGIAAFSPRRAGAPAAEQIPAAESGSDARTGDTA